MPRKPVALFVAEAVAIDQLTGRLTAFNILENVFAADLPALLHRVTCVASYELGASAVQFFERGEFVNPAGKVLSSTTPIHVDLAIRASGKTPNAATNIHTFWNTRVEVEGDHLIAVSHATSPDGPWERAASRVVTIVKAAHPLAARATPGSAGG
jgi:hypothetical protein